MTYTQPLLLLCVVLAFAGLFRLWQCRRKGLAIVGVAALALVCWPPVEWLLSRPLEGRYPVRPFKSSAGLQAIVVFSEAVASPTFERPYPQASLGTAERCEYAASIRKST